MGAEADGQWWGGWLIEIQNGNLVENFIGAIKVPMAYDAVDPASISNFVEYFGETVSKCEDVPLSIVGFLPPAFNFQGEQSCYAGYSTYSGTYRPSGNTCVSGAEGQGAFVTVGPYDFGFANGALAFLGGRSTSPALGNHPVPGVVDACSSRIATLTVSGGSGRGTVKSQPTGIDCGGDCSETYTSGTSVTLTSTPKPGYVVGNWEGACGGTDPVCVLSMTGNKTVVPGYDVAPGYFELSVTKTNDPSLGNVLSSPPGINCGSDCVRVYPVGAQVTLAAQVSNPSCRFLGWRGSCSGTAVTCTVTMDSAKTVIAQFERARKKLPLGAILLLLD